MARRSRARKVKVSLSPGFKRSGGRLPGKRSGALSTVYPHGAIEGGRLLHTAGGPYGTPQTYRIMANGSRRIV